MISVFEKALQNGIQKTINYFLLKEKLNKTTKLLIITHFCTLTTDELCIQKNRRKYEFKKFYHYHHHSILKLKNEALDEFKEKTVFQRL